VKRGREWVASAALAGGGLLFALLLVEGGVRLLHLLPDRFWEPDPVLGVRLVPGRSGWWTQEDREFLVYVQINKQGRRDVERPVQKAAGTFRILVLGDSFVEALQVPLEAAFPRVLEASLAAGEPVAPVEVISAGVSGHGTASELLFFEREGRRYQPDLVVLAFYPGNDVKNNSPTLEDRFTPVYGADGALERVEGQWREEASGWRARLPRLQAYLYARQMVLLRRPDLAAQLADLGLIRAEAIRQAPQWDGVPLDYGVYATPLAPEWEDAWTRTERLLDQMREAVRESGATFVVLILSIREQTYPESWKEIVAAYPAMHSRQWDLDAPQRRLEAWCARREVPCVSLAAAFRGAAARGSEFLHYPREGHWTPVGHRLAAEVLEDFLRQDGLLPAAKGG
jgi:lysophospholipase L1-like esterase